MPRRSLFSPLLLIIVVMVIAALALASYSYRSARMLAAMSEATMETSNRVLGLRLISRIEKAIIDTDRTLFKLVRLDDPKEFRELWRRIVKVSPAVQSAIVVTPTGQIRHFVDKRTPKRRRRFLHTFKDKILPDLRLQQLGPEQHKHLHDTYDGESHLLSYIGRQRESDIFFIVLNMNIPYILREMLIQEFKDFEESSAISVVEDSGHALYGQPLAPGSRLVHEGRFETTLYRWRLQIAPREQQALEQQARAQRLFDLALIGASAGVMLAGIILLVLAVRKERIANQLKSDFIANLSHELKTPLSLIRMFGELLGLGRASAEKSKEYASIITRESDRLTNLIDNVLDFARIERGKAAYRFTTGNLGTLLERVVELCRYRSEQAGVTLDVDIAPDLPEVTFDESAMTLLFLNLIENALRHGARKGQAIEIRLGRREDSLVFTVTDHGPGVPPEEQRRVFDRFFRGEEARQRTRGSGIGLSLVKHIADAHSATVRLESDLGKGATFEVDLPLANQ